MDPYRDHPPSESSSPILAISIVGILTSSILLLSYYVFVIKSCFNVNCTDVIRRLSQSQRRWTHTNYLSTVTNQGLDESTIQAIPTLRFRRGEQHNSFHECAVCLNAFQVEERIRLLPNCFHVFHIDCIDTWLQTHVNCPLCRAEITTISLASAIQQITVDVRDDGSEHDSITETSDNANPVAHVSMFGKERKLHRVSSFKGKDEQFVSAQPMRRSFSLNSFNDRQLYMAAEEKMRQNTQFGEVGNGEGTSNSSERSRKLFLLFGSIGQISRSAVLPIHQNEN